MFGCGNGEDQRRVGVGEQYNQNAFYVQNQKPVQNKIQNIFLKKSTQMSYDAIPEEYVFKRYCGS